MATLSEYLKYEENQSVVRESVIDLLRSSEKWGKRGLFVEIAKKTGFTAAYIGQVLNGKKPFTDEFLNKLAGYCGVPVAYLKGGESEVEWNREDALDILWSISDEYMLKFMEKNPQATKTEIRDYVISQKQNIFLEASKRLRKHEGNLSELEIHNRRFDDVVGLK